MVSGLLGSLIAERLQRAQPAGQEAVINTVLAGFWPRSFADSYVESSPRPGSTSFGDLLIVDWSDLTKVFVSAAAMALLLITRYRQLVFMGVDPDGAVAAGLPVKALQLFNPCDIDGDR